MTANELGWRPYVKTWLATWFSNNPVCTDALKEHLWVTFDATIDVGLAFLEEYGVEAIKTTDLQQVVGLCNFLECFID